MKKSVCIFLLILLFTVIISGCSYEEKSINDKNQNDSTTEENSTIPQENIFVKDDVVNRFITEYNNISPYPIDDIREGNIRTKFFGYSNDCYLEMINANNAYAEYFSLSINGGNEEDWYNKILEVYKYSVKILDSNLTNQQIEESIKEIKKSNYGIQNYHLGETIIISFYSIKELSYGKTDCRIDVEANNYK